MTRNLRKTFELKFVNELKLQPKAFRRNTNSCIKAKADIGSLKNDGVLVSDSKGKADIPTECFLVFICLRSEMTKVRLG